MELYQLTKPCAKVMWFYGEEEMVVSKNELNGIHEKEIFASTCFDEVRNDQHGPPRSRHGNLNGSRFVSIYRYIVVPVGRTQCDREPGDSGVLTEG